MLDMSDSIDGQAGQASPKGGGLKLHHINDHGATSKNVVTLQRQRVASLPVRQKWYQWFSPSDTPEERRLILKLDALIMIFVFLAYWAKVLDQSATSAAYVSGMKEDLKLFGNELNYLNTTYMVGFITLQIPLTLLVSIHQDQQGHGSKAIQLTTSITTR